ISGKSVVGDSIPTVGDPATREPTSREPERADSEPAQQREESGDNRLVATREEGEDPVKSEVSLKIVPREPSLPRKRTLPPTRILIKGQLYAHPLSRGIYYIHCLAGPLEAF